MLWFLIKYYNAEQMLSKLEWWQIVVAALHEAYYTASNKGGSKVIIDYNNKIHDLKILNKHRIRICNQVED